MIYAKKKILFILPTLDAGGAENYVLRFISYNLQHFEFHVLSLKPHKGDLYSKFYELGIQVHLRSLGYLDFRKIDGFYKFLRINKFDTVCGFNGNFDGLPLTLARLSGVSNRISFYRRSTIAFKKNIYKSGYNYLVNKLVKQNATIILSNSKVSFENFFGNSYIGNSKFKVIPNGLDEKVFDINVTKNEAREQLNLPQDVFIIGHVGRLDSSKNHQTIFKVAKELNKSCKNILFLYCGKNTDSSAFEKELKNYGILKTSITMGVREDLPMIYKAMDVFYFPSLTEGQPNALIEAMISGLPIITSNILPILETLPDNAHGLTLPPKNVSKAVDLLESFYNKKVIVSNFIYKDWAKLRFDVNTNFKLFKDLL